MTLALPARRRTNSFDVSVIAFLICASSLTVFRLDLSPKDPSTGVALIYAPWTSASQTLVQSVSAGARFVRFGSFPFIAVVIPERPDYAERVTAWAVVDPQVLAGCLGTATSTSVSQ
jgi:hypothetical protein